MHSPSSVITLGTAGGPMQNPQRAQPAHVLLNGNRPILIDCGEGAMGQLKRAGIEYRDVHHIFLTHHHFDHIGSLYACLGLNMMTQRKEPLRIYGPAGTQAIVDGLCAACDVPNAIGFGVSGQQLPHPRDFVEVIEIAPGDEITLDGLKMTCCENTHYRTEDQFGEDGYHSLSLRFDLDDRSVVFTGDTGPCDALVTVSQGADLIVGEMMDLEITMGRIRAMNQGIHIFAGPFNGGFVPMQEDLMYVFLLSQEPDTRPFPVEGAAAAMRNRAKMPPPQFAAILDQITDDAGVVARPLETIMLEGDWHKGRVVLMGDAVHGSTPHLAQGAGMAIEDGLVLADELTKTDNPADAFAAYRTRRMPRVSHVAKNSVRIGEMQMGKIEPFNVGELTGQTIGMMCQPI